jgi:nucleoside-diphosphate-sugar epimerase
LHLAITGGTGFLGRRIVALAADAGHRVTVLCRDPRAAQAAAAHAPAVARGGAAARGSVRWARFELERAAAGVDALAAEPPHALIHAAAIIRGTMQELRACNVEATAAIVGALSRWPRPPRLVLVSSFSAEDLPASHYSESKRAAETLLRESALPWVVVRPTLIYGAGDGGATAALVGELREGTMWLPRGGRALIQPVHVDDVAAACLAAAERPQAVGRTYRLGGPEPVSVADFRGAVRDATGGRAEIRELPLGLLSLAATALSLVGRRGPAEAAAFHARDHVVDSSQAAADLDFRPRPLAEGLAQTFAR